MPERDPFRSSRIVLSFASDIQGEMIPALRIGSESMASRGSS